MLEEDTGTGIFSTDFCVDLSAELNKAPSVIAVEVLSKGTPSLEGLSLGVSGDFIHVDVAPEWFHNGRLRELVRIEVPGPSAIVVPRYVQTAALPAYLRTMSLGWEQFVILQSQKVESRLYAGDRKFDSIGGFSGYGDAIGRLKKGEAAEPETACESMAWALSEAEDMKAFVWLSSDALPKPVFQRFFHENIHRRPSHVLRCPDANWNMSREAMRIPAYIDNAVREQLFSFLMYLTGEIPATDLDLHVPALREKDNIVWFLSSLLSRLERIGGDASAGDACGACSGGPPSVLPRLRRLTALYPFFLSRAAAHGEVERLNKVIRRAAQLVNIALNDAVVREGLRGKVEHAGLDVIEEAAAIFSVISAWPACQDYRQDWRSDAVGS